MAYQALYRTYRPNTFDEVVGQKYIVKTLRNAIEKNKIAHAYLFCGPRGTGKTTIARILAKAINCENDTVRPCNECASCRMIQEGTHPDIIEIDGASYGTVDTTRDLIDKVKYAPLQGKYKVYIIDEVHMLSNSSFNTLLKTLEEPPSHAIFILATTDPQKVLPTIISRCQRFDFEKVSQKDITERLIYILNNEHIEYEQEALEEISFLADGGLRDALSILDQVIAYSPEKITLDAVYQIYGITSKHTRFEMMNKIADQNTEAVLDLSTSLAGSGTDIKRFTNDLLEIAKQCVIYEQTRERKFLRDITVQDTEELLGKVSTDELLKWIDVLVDTGNQYRYSANAASTFEIALLKMIHVVNTGKEKITLVRSQEAPVTEKKPEVKPVEVKEEKKPVIQTEEQKNEQITIELEDKKEEPVIQTDAKTEEYSDEYLLGLLVGANKQKKKEMSDSWFMLNEMALQDKYVKYVSALRECQASACGNNYAILTAKHATTCDFLNSVKKDPVFREIFIKMLGTEQVIFAVTNDRFSALVETFRDRLKNKTLPKPVEILTEQPKEETSEIENKLDNLFGKGQYEMMGE